LPLDAINLGQSDDDKAFLLLELGIASLLRAVAEQIGQTILLLSAKASSTAS
jgi:hypothetical protein